MRKLVLFSALMLAACAKSPGSIEPSAIPSDAYMGMSCHRLAQENARVSTLLADASAKQSSAAAGDALGVFLIAVPVSSLSGNDVGGDVARLKGEKAAVERVMRAKACPI